MLTSKTVKAETCSSSDLPQCFSVMDSAFGDDAPFVDTYFPNHSTPTGRAQGTARLQKWHAGDPHSTFLKVVMELPSGDERILGFAVWTYTKESPSKDLATLENIPEHWPEELEARFMRALWAEYITPRGEAIKSQGEKGAYVLELLAVHPDAQRRGVGAALVRWGTEKADKQGLEALVESTAFGKPLYEKCGFQTAIEQMRFDLGVEFQDRKKPKLAFMRRPPEM